MVSFSPQYLLQNPRRKADAWGRKPLFLAGFAVLPVRGLLFALSDDPYFIVAIQILDGVGAGIFGVLFIAVMMVIAVPRASPLPLRERVG